MPIGRKAIPYQCCLILGIGSCKCLLLKVFQTPALTLNAYPNHLRTMVNEYHAVYGVGTVKDIATFNVRCSNHPDKSMARCRQCRARREAAKLHAMKQQGVEITRGLLVRRQWIIPSQAETKVRAIEELQREDPIMSESPQDQTHPLWEGSHDGSIFRL